MPLNHRGSAVVEGPQDITEPKIRYKPLECNIHKFFAPLMTRSPSERKNKVIRVTKKV